METVDLEMLSVITGSASTLISYYFMMMQPFLKAILVASEEILPGTALLFLGYTLIKSFSSPQDFGKNLLSAVGFIAFLYLLMTPVSMRADDIQGNELDYEKEFVVPLGVFVSWKGIMSGYTLIMATITENLPSGPSQSVATAAIIKANSDTFDGGWRYQGELYSDYVQHCSMTQQEINSAQQQMKTAETVTESDLYAVGLNGGNGIFLNAQTTGESNIGIESDIVNEPYNAFTGGVSESVDTLNQLRTESIHHILDAGMITSGTSFANESRRIANKESVVKAKSILTYEDITTGLKHRYRVQTTPAHKNSDPQYLIDESIIPDATWKGSQLREIKKAEIEQRGGNVDATMAALDMMYEGYFVPENCWEMYLITRTGIQYYQRYLVENGFQLADEASLGLANEWASSELGTLVSINASKMMYQGFMARKLEQDNNAFDEGGSVKKSVAQLGFALNEFKNTMSGFDAELTLPFIISGLSAGAAFLVLLLPLMVAISPILGGPQIIIRTLQLLLVVYLSLIIFFLSFTIGDALKSSIFDAVRMSLTGPGAQSTELMMMAATLNTICITIAGTFSIGIAYLIITSDASALRKMSTAGSAAIGAAAGSAAMMAVTRGRLSAPKNNSGGGGGGDSEPLSGTHIPGGGSGSSGSTPPRSSGNTYDMNMSSGNISSTPKIPSSGKGFSLRK